MTIKEGSKVAFSYFEVKTYPVFFLGGAGENKVFIRLISIYCKP